jgi:hypothetical protein
MDRPGTRNGGSKGEGRLVNQFSQPSPLLTLPPRNYMSVERRASISTALNKTRTEVREEVFKETWRDSGVSLRT